MLIKQSFLATQGTETLRKCFGCWLVNQGALPAQQDILPAPTPFHVQNIRGTFTLLWSPNGVCGSVKPKGPEPFPSVAQILPVSWGWSSP